MMLPILYQLRQTAMMLKEVLEGPVFIISILKLKPHTSDRALPTLSWPLASLYTRNCVVISRYRN